MSSVKVESREKKKKRRKKNKSLPPSFSSLPNEIAVTCLARISRLYYPTLSIVSKSFCSLLSSNELYTARSHLGRTEPCLYVLLGPNNNKPPQWFRLCINPSRTLVRQLLVPIPSSNVPYRAMPTIVVVGSEVYVIGGRANGIRSSDVNVLDCRSHTWRDAPSMNVARESFVACVYDGKIYVMGGCKEHESWAEVFDINTQTWECLSNPSNEIRECSVLQIMEMEGKIKFGGLTNYMYAYDTKEGKWESCGNNVHPWYCCVIDNIPYHYSFVDGLFFTLWWHDTNKMVKAVKGLESLEENHLMENRGSNVNLVSYGGKLLLIWEVYMMKFIEKKIICAKIALEKRLGEIWGNVEWVDVVSTVNISCPILHCLAAFV